MWLIAESGSTKTEWRLCDSNAVEDNLITDGLNPLFFDQLSFEEFLTNNLPKEWRTEAKKLWFYSAGCGEEDIKASTKAWLNSVFKRAKIEVESDLLAAARATYGTSKGLVAILGTGSNSGRYDGVRINEHIKSLGFLLGDEGSGTSIGRSLLKRLIRNEFSSNLNKDLLKEIGLTTEEIINRIYSSHWPNRFIASHVRILHNHIDEKEIHQLVYKEFEEFALLLLNYQNATGLKINFVGSVAYYFASILQEAVENNGFIMGKVLESPIDALVNYHLQNAKA